MMSLTVHVAKDEQIQSHNRTNPALRVQFRRPDCAGLTIGKVEPISIGGNSAGLGQGCTGQLPVGNGFDTGPGIRANIAVGQVHHPQLVRTRHGDVELAIVMHQVPGGV